MPHIQVVPILQGIISLVNRVIHIIKLVLFLCLTSCWQKNGEEKLLAILNIQSKEYINPNNEYSGVGKLQYYDSLLSTLPENQRPLALLLEKCDALLQLGRTFECIQILEEVLKKNNSEYLSSVKDKLALAYLRLGEQNNCISNHSSESCVFPVQGMGIHVNTFGSRNAIALYEELLEKSPSDLNSKWLANLAYMTLGEYPKNVPPGLLIPGLDSDTLETVKPFEDIAPDLKLDVRTMAGGTIIEDFDNDGYLDLVTSGWNLSEPLHYFRNRADGTFEDLSEKSGLKRFTGGLNIMQTDYNNDNFKDIFVTRGAWEGKFGQQPNSLLRNNGNGTFTDVTIESGLLSFNPTQTATWNDFNNDGWLDVFIGNEADFNIAGKGVVNNCEFFLNNKDGSFTEMASKVHCDVTSYVKGVTSGDYNKDGWQDIFISTISGRRILLRNNGLKNGTLQFEDVTVEAKLNSENNNTFPTWFFDYDNDGWLDIFVCDYTFTRPLSYYAADFFLNPDKKPVGHPIVYKNNQNGTFSNVTEQLGLLKPCFAMGSNFGDIDNDGYLDIFLGTGNASYKSLVPNKMFRNLGGKKFADVTTSAKVGNIQKGHGVGFGDLDNDGDQDIYIDMGGAYFGDAYQSSFLLNPGQSNNNWISVISEGDKANKAAIGSRIKLTFTEKGKKRSVYRDINSGGSFGASSLRKEIGVGNAEVIDELEITWHGSSRKQTFKNIAVNQFIKIKEGQNPMQNLNLTKIMFKRSSGFCSPR